MSKTITSNQKPTDYDIHLKYLCPECGGQHWLSFLEASTKQFKVVCYCGCVFSVKRVSKFKIRYCKPATQKPQTTTTSNKQSHLSADILGQCVKVLVGYGFTKTEAEKMIENSYSVINSNDIGLLIKTSLENIKHGY